MIEELVSKLVHSFVHSLSPRHEEHRAAAFSRQPTLSCTAPLTSAHLVDLPILDSFSTIFLHVVLGHLPLLFPSGCHSITTMQSSFPSFLSMWPIQFHLLLQEFITALLYACYLRNCVILDTLWPPNS